MECKTDSVSRVVSAQSAVIGSPILFGGLVRMKICDFREQKCQKVREKSFFLTQKLRNKGVISSSHIMLEVDFLCKIVFQIVLT